MKEQLQKRLIQLKTDFDAGQKMLSEKRQEAVNMEATLIRIQGAVTVLEEELKKAEEIPKETTL
jgi:hypothetical protein